MIRSITNRLRRFNREEDGSATVEFAIFFSIIVTIFTASVEVGYLNLRHAMLERSVDLTVRDIRLATGQNMSYSEVRTSICERAALIPDCEENLRLEMVVVDPRAFAPMSPDADCHNAEEEPRPLRQFRYGQDNELMLMRACLAFKPIFPTTGLGYELTKDDEGYAQLIVTSAFVQEPR